MHSNDQHLLNEAYRCICTEEQIQLELRNLLLSEKDQGLWDKISSPFKRVGQEISDVSQNVWDWASLDMPQFITKLGDFIANTGMQVAAGGVGTYIVGQALLMLVKKMNKEADQNYDIMLQMLPAEMQKKISVIENMDKNTAEYKAALFNIQKRSLKELEKALNSKGIKTTSGVFAKILQYIGNFFTSFAGSLAGAIVIPVLIYKMGFNPLPTVGN